MLHGILCGYVYIKTRNILFPILMNTYIVLPDVLSTIGIAFENDLLIQTPDFFTILNQLVTILVLVYILWVIFKKIPSKTRDLILKRSPPEMKRGIEGYLVISFSLMLILITVIEIFRKYIDSQDDLVLSVFVRIIFYGIIFTIPFFLTISTEYARDSAD